MGEVIKLSAAELRKRIMEVQDIRREPVEVPEWGLTLWVRGMTGRERDQYEESLLEGRGNKARFRFRDARARMVVLCTTDEDGNRVFTDSDVEWLTNKSAAALDRLWGRIRELSGLSVKDEEELEGNPSSEPSNGSASVQSGDSGSA